jgi:hypothetical protein
VDARSDIYSLGVILYQMLTKDVPFRGDSFAAIVSGHLTQAPPSIRARNPAVSPELEAVILRALSKNPANRQANVRELLAELEAAIAPKPSAAAPSAPLQAAPRLLITTFPGNCTIEVDGDFRGKTDAQGRFELRLPPGEYRIRFTSPGWNDLARTVVMGNSDQSLEIRLTHKTTVMATAPAVGLPFPTSPATGSFAPPTGSPLTHTGKLRTSTGSLPVPPSTPISLSVAPGAAPTSGLNIALDTILTIAGVLAGLAAFVVFPSDPLSLRWDKTLMPGTSWWTGSAGMAAVIAVPACLLLADYVYPYRPVPFLVMVFNIVRVLFLVVVVGGTIVAALGALANHWEMPTMAWFSIRGLSIAALAFLYSRIAARRRAVIV